MTKRILIAAAVVGTLASPLAAEDQTVEKATRHRTVAPAATVEPAAPVPAEPETTPDVARIEESEQARNTEQIAKLGNAEENQNTEQIEELGPYYWNQAADQVEELGPYYWNQ